MCGVATAVVAADQLTKWWARHVLAHRTIHLIWTLRLALTTNRAGAFGLGGSLVPFFALAAIAVAVVAATIGSGIRRPRVAVTVGLVLGGAVGNLTDRVVRAPGGLRGSVVDFIDLRWWPVFNVADAAITIGCVALVLLGRSRPSPEVGS